MIMISGNSNKPLAEAISRILNMPLSKIEIQAFDDSEICIQLLSSVRGKHVFIIQPLSAPVNDHLMTLLILIDALKRSSAAEITAVIPYFAYGRQDRKMQGRLPIASRLVADLLQTAGASRVVSVDFHSKQIEGFFKIPTDNLFAAPLFARSIKARFKTQDMVIASPDIGGVNRARAVAKRLGCELIILEKRRELSGEIKIISIIGQPFQKNVVLIDDILDSGSTLCQAAEALHKAGAKHISAYVTHGIFSPGSIDLIKHSKINQLYTTDSIFLKEEVRKCEKIQCLSLAPLLAEVIARIAQKESLSNLFDANFENM